MPQKNKIHIMGASGSGTTSIAGQLCKAIGYQHFDTDDFYWHKTSPPYIAARETQERQQLLSSQLTANNQWVLSGSLCGWGDLFIPFFDLVIYVYVKNDVRVERLRQREFARYGEAIFSEGELGEKYQTFIQWAAAYDTSTEISRNAYKHRKWLENIGCPVVEITNHTTCDAAVERIITHIRHTAC